MKYEYDGQNYMGKISEWEIENHATLCDELKEFYLFTNSMDLFFDIFYLKIRGALFLRGWRLGLR